MKTFLLKRIVLALLILNFGFAVFQTGVVVAQKSLYDDTIAHRVMIKLATDPEVKAGAIKVEVVQGVVTLSGTVETQRAKTKAGNLAKKVKDVKHVVNNLTLTPH